MPTAAEIAQARKDRQAARTAGKEAGDAKDMVPITEAATLALPEPFTIGDTEPLRIHLCAPPISAAKKVYSGIMTVWPDVFLAAAITDRAGKGIDIEKARAFGADLPTEDGAAFDPEGEIQAFTKALFSYEPGTGNILDAIAGTVWSLAEGHNDDITLEALPQLLMDRLRPVQFADLLRALLRACSGCDTAYESDIHSRFD